MRYNLAFSGLLALGCSAVTLAAAVPKADAEGAAATTTNGTHILNVHRDWKRLHTAVRAKLQSGGKDKGSVEKRSSSLDPNGLDYAGYWFADVTAGGLPAQALLDTGSADFWLVSPQAQGDGTNGVQTWDPSAAADTTIMDGYTFNIGYGQGGNGVNGSVYQTNVCMGTACTNMAVGSATYDQGLNFARSGILGMAFQGGNSIRPNQQPTFMEALEPQLDQPIFVTKFAPEGSQSQIAFGSNPFNYVAPLQQISVQSGGNNQYSYSWSFSGAEYFKNGQSLGTFDVVFDTGGPMTSAAIGIVRGYYNGIPGARDVNGDGSSWTVPCGTPLPDLELHLGGALLIIPGQKFYNGNTATSGDCTVWLVKENSASRAVIGDPFFEEHVVIWNQRDGTLQWGNQA